MKVMVMSPVRTRPPAGRWSVLLPNEPLPGAEGDALTVEGGDLLAGGGGTSVFGQGWLDFDPEGKLAHMDPQAAWQWIGIDSVPVIDWRGHIMGWYSYNDNPPPGLIWNSPWGYGDPGFWP